MTAVLSNIINTCFGGTKSAISQPGACQYGVIAAGGGGGVGNAYNPGTEIQPYVQNAYTPTTYAGYPFNVYVSAKLKL